MENNPCSTQALCKNAKLAAVEKAGVLFRLREDQCEALANKAGLSRVKTENGLAEILSHHCARYNELQRYMTVSERMLQYYVAGKEPTKRSLLAISISLQLPLNEMQQVLGKYGYCLSRSLPNDAVVLWFLKNSSEKGISMVHQINETLELLDLPLLMTQLYQR